MENFDGHDPCCFELACAFDQSDTVVFNLFIKTQFLMRKWHFVMCLALILSVLQIRIEGQWVFTHLFLA